MSLMMNPVLPAAGPETPVQKTARNKGSDNSFGAHLDRQLDEKYGGNRDKLGVSSPREKRPVQRDGERPEAPDKEKEQADNGSVASLLSQFMAELQEVAEKKLGAPGEWNVSLPDMEVLKELAINAGMTEADFIQLFQKINGQDNKVGLADFFAALRNHFDQIEEAAAVTVPEAELPLLESLLARMGLSEASLAELAAKAVPRDGVFDLMQFLQGLKGLEGGDQLQSVTLTDFEAEQLQNLLAQAGVTLEEQNELLPERFLNQVLGRDNAGDSVKLTMDRLQNILQNSIANVQQNQPKVDLPAFLNDLQQIVAQSNFESQSVGFTPVVQETVNAVFQKLQEIVDLAKIRVEEGRALEEQYLSEDVSKWVKALDEKFSFSQGQDGAADFAGGSLNRQAAQGETPEVSVTTTPTVVTFTATDVAAEPTSAPEAARGATPLRTPSRQLQQQIVQQLSAGVMRGLKNQDHHLVLRLFPQDLGEVKVNLMVREEQVSVSFNMENAKVKEMLESNMQEFKDSMNQKGFTLGECSVSVGQQDEGSEMWQRFEMAQKLIRATRKTIAELPSDALYLQGAHRDGYGRPDGISLIV